MNRTLLTVQHREKFMSVFSEAVVSHQCVKKLGGKKS